MTARNNGHNAHEAELDDDELGIIDGEEDIPDIVIRRLPTYARSLAYMLQEGITTVSSSELASRIGGTAAQIRRDLSYFGEFGKQGKGYNVNYLLEQIKEILNMDRDWHVALVGIGNLGQALVHYDGFRERGFHIVAAFDRDPKRIAHTKMEGIELYPMDKLTEVLKEKDIAIGIIAVPAEGAQEVADELVKAGIRAILNYAPIIVQVPDNVRIRHIDPISGLQSMTYYLSPNRARTKKVR